jgi:CSLREA domain-containing protein
MRYRPLPLIPLFLLAACGENQPTAPVESGGIAESQAAALRVVNSLADPGNGVCDAAQCTLREAINDPASTEITFAPSLTGPITLAPPGDGGGRLEIDKPLTITGPTRRIAIQGRSPDLAFPIFHIGRGATVTLRSLILRNGGFGVVSRGTLTVTNCIVAGNSGDGISSRHSTLTLANSSIVDNSGAGIEAVGFGTATVTGSRVARNSSSGIRVRNAGVTITNSTVAGNSAGDGGGIANEAGAVTIDRSTITNNSATGQGGGILNTVDDPFRRNGASITLTNSTVSGNSAGTGGGIANSPQRSSLRLTLTNTTVARNSATEEGGGIFQRGLNEEDGAVLTLRNSLVAQNSAATGSDVLNSDAEFGFVFARFNLIGNGSGSGISDGVDGNQVGSAGAPIDPRLAALANYGGPTSTHRLLPGSPALDAASAADCPATDQRGVPRPQGAGCDVGSFERK